MAEKQTAELEKLLQRAFDKGASDLLLIPNEPACFRVKGYIERSEETPLTAEEIEKIAEKAFGKRLKKLGKEVGELITSCSLPGVVDGRMCVAKSLGDYTIVIRLLPNSIPQVKEIRIPEALVKLGHSPYGLILFAGPTGSGKTTSLLSVLDDINGSGACHICTVEDPICYRMVPKKALIQQREVGVDVPDVVSGISAAMRQDLDVILIGELKNVEEVQAGVSAAETGHLVLAQMHSGSAHGAIQRLLDIQPEENLTAFRKVLSEVLLGVSIQRILPRADGKGRVPAYGLLLLSDEMRRALARGERLEDWEGALPEGCQTLKGDMERLFGEGLITEETLKRFTGKG